MATVDEDRDEDQVPQNRGVQPNAESGLRPVAQAPLVPGDDDEFEVIETDDQGKPFGGEAPAPEERPEARLSQEESGTQPLIRPNNQDGEQQPQRRETRSTRNARRREARDRTSQELQELRDRYDRLEARVGTQVEPRLLELGETQIRTQASRLDSMIQDADAAASNARRAIATAMQNTDNDALVLALDARDEALIRSTQLKNEKKQVDKVLEGFRSGGQDDPNRQVQRQPEQREQQRQTQPPPLPTRVRQYVQDFQQDHDWYNPQDNTDVDSQIVLAIDRAVAAEGFQPDSQDYWQEIDDRMREKMPWRFQEDGQQQQRQQPARQQTNGRQTQQTPAQQQRRGPPTSGNSDRAAQGAGRKTVTISPMRKEAMIQAGAIDNGGRILDKPKYQRLLKSYDEFDRTNPVR